MTLKKIFNIYYNKYKKEMTNIIILDINILHIL